MSVKMDILIRFLGAFGKEIILEHQLKLMIIWYTNLN